MRSAIALAVGLLAYLPVAIACEAPTTPLAIVKKIYRDLSVNDDELSGPPLMKRMRTPEARADHWTPELVALFQKDAEIAERKGGIGCLDTPISFDGNSYDEREFAATTRVVQTLSEPDKEVVDVTFKHFGEDQHFRWSFKKEGSDWKVSEVELVGHWALSKLSCE